MEFDLSLKQPVFDDKSSKLITIKEMSSISLLTGAITSEQRNFVPKKFLVKIYFHVDRTFSNEGVAKIRIDIQLLLMIITNFRYDTGHL